MTNRLTVLALLICTSIFAGPADAATGTQNDALPARVDRYGDPLPEGAVARLGSLRFWHDSHVGFTADSKKLMSVVKGRAGNDLRFWDLATGKTTARPLPMKEAESCFFSSNRRYLVIQGWNATTRVVNLDSGRVRELSTQLTAQAISADGKLLLATRGLSGTIREPFPILLRSVATGERLAVLHGHKTWVSVLAFLPDGKRFISVSDEYKRNPPDATIEGTICFWDLSTHKLLRQLRHPGGNPGFSAVSPDGKLLYYYGSKDYRSHLWDLEADKEITGSEEEIDDRWQAAFYPNVKGIRRITKLLGKDSFIAAVSPDGKILASRRHLPAEDLSTRLWDTTTGREIRPLGGHQDVVLCLAYTPDGKALLSGGKDGRVIRWDAKTGKELHSYETGGRPVRAVAVSADGQTIAAGCQRNKVYLWELSSGKKLHEFETLPLLNDLGLGSPEAQVREQLEGIRFLAFTKGGKRLIVGSSSTRPSRQRQQKNPDDATPEEGFAGLLSLGTISTWDVATGKRLALVKKEGETPIALSPQGSAAAWTAGKGSLFEWTSELLLRRLDADDTAWRLKGAQNESFNRVEFSPDGKRLLVTSSISFFTLGPGGSPPRHFYRLLNVATGAEIRKVEKYQGRLFFSPDGRFAASTAPGKGVYLLDPTSGQSTRPFTGHEARVTTCAFSPDQRHLATASADHTILIWDLAARKLK
jgi:WD40 repeat protein